MKNILLILSALFLISACTNNGGGVTSEPGPAAPPSDPGDPGIPATPQFTANLSQVRVYNSSNQVITTDGKVGEAYKLVFLAKDQFGVPFSGLSVKLGLQSVPGYIDIVAAEGPTGQYVININPGEQGIFTGYVKVNDTELINLEYIFNLSFCNDPISPAAAPFHSQISYHSKSYYVICSADQLAASASTSNLNKNLLLGMSIDLDSYYTDANSDQIPDNQFKIGSDASPFLGDFNGSGFIITHFKYLSNSENNVGLFGLIGDGSIVQNLTLTSSQVKGGDSVGSLIGKILNNGSQAATVDGLYLFGNTVFGNNNIGGVIGEVQSSSGKTVIKNSSSLITQNVSSATANMSRIGGFIGYNNGGSVDSVASNQTFINSSTTFVISKVGGLIGESIAQNGSTLNNIRIFSTQTYSSGFSIGCLAGAVSNSIITLVGNGSICLINQSGSGTIVYSGGLFGQMTNSNLSDSSLSLVAQNIKSTFGGIAGFTQSSTISKFQIAGTIDSNVGNIGGISGVASDSNISSILSYISVANSTNSNSIGGIVGAGQNMTMNKISIQSPVSATLSSSVGGLIGVSSGTLSLTNTLNNSSVSGDSQVGGLIGSTMDDSLKSVSNSYSSGAVLANSNVGGMIGYMSGANTSISNSFSIARVQTSSGTIATLGGSLIGSKVDPASTLSNNYYLSEATTLTSVCGSGTCAATDTNTSADLSTDILYYINAANAPFDTWDTTTTWYINNIYLPSLKF